MANKKRKLEIDEIGKWSEIKLAILREYASAYARVLHQKLKFEYVDGFAGAGEHLSKATGQPVAGSPLLVLDVTPTFDAYHFVDIDEDRINNLAQLTKSRTGVSLYHGDSNRILVEKSCHGLITQVSDELCAYSTPTV